MRDDADLDRLLADHAVRADVDAIGARRIRARAHDAMHAPRGLSFAWLEPTLALAIGVTQIVWAFHAVLALYR
ncbi:MAG TPA: hypothetical protein VL463_26015 [Kofleriaceae bacterium]|jgi:hypothetical protein|nr:hypothetical protein [Kofleriaceae bacterium]